MGERLVVVGLGDSTTAGTPAFLSPLEAPPSGMGNPESQYGYWVTKAHPGWRFLNKGINGQRTDQMLSRFGRDVIPAVIHTHKVFAYPFLDENRKKDAYWRDVGTLEAYYDANMDLISVDPLLNLYDRHWPIRTYQANYPPPKFVFADLGEKARRGQALDSIVCHGTIISGGQVERSVLGPNVRINSYSHVEGSVLFAGVNVGRHAKVRRAIIDKEVEIPAGIEIGYDHELDRSRGFVVSETGLTVLAKTHGVEHFART